ncbi:MAG: fumarate hydratase, partial [Rhodospirillales bacterium]|nr:fumarate hydratase [Rhodospirillales bacterium]
MSKFVHHEMFPVGDDKTPYRKLTGDFVSTAKFDGETVLKVEPKALTVLAAEAFRDISHLLRPGH